MLLQLGRTNYSRETQSPPWFSLVSETGRAPSDYAVTLASQKRRLKERGVKINNNNQNKKSHLINGCRQCKECGGPPGGGKQGSPQPAGDAPKTPVDSRRPH